MIDKVRVLVLSVLILEEINSVKERIKELILTSLHYHTRK